MKQKRKLGDKINRGFTGLVIVLFGVMMIRFAYQVVITDPDRESDFELCEDQFPNGDSNTFILYPETQDDFAETANGLDIPVEEVDSTLNAEYAPLN